jgi:hypothetical protein
LISLWNKYSRLHENYFRSKIEKAPNHPSLPFKEKEKGGEGGSMFGGEWKIPCLVDHGM